MSGSGALTGFGGVYYGDITGRGFLSFSFFSPKANSTRSVTGFIYIWERIYGMDGNL